MLPLAFLFRPALRVRPSAALVPPLAAGMLLYDAIDDILAGPKEIEEAYIYAFVLFYAFVLRQRIAAAEAGGS